MIQLSMLLPIHDRLLISEVQERFSAAFPGLKIEFCSRRRLKGSQLEKYIISPGKRIGEIRSNRNEGSLDISSGFSPTRLENEFHKHFGLHIQLYWKNQKHWEMILFTNHVSLAQYDLKARADRSHLPDVRDQ